MSDIIVTPEHPGRWHLLHTSGPQPYVNIEGIPTPITDFQVIDVTPLWVFSTVVDHLSRMTKRCDDGSGQCKYRGPSDCRCAAGCLIADEEYRPAMEGNSINDRPIVNQLPRRLIPHIELIKDLQLVHDSASSWRGLMGRHLRDVAHKHAIQFNIYPGIIADITAAWPRGFHYHVLRFFKLLPDDVYLLHMEPYTSLVHDWTLT